MQKMAPDVTSAHLLPILSDSEPDNRLPTKQPTCRSDTMFAANALVVDSDAWSRPNDLFKTSADASGCPSMSSLLLERLQCDGTANERQVITKEESAHRSDHGNAIDLRIVNLAGRRHVERLCCMSMSHDGSGSRWIRPVQVFWRSQEMSSFAKTRCSMLHTTQAATRPGRNQLVIAVLRICARLRSNFVEPRMVGEHMAFTWEVCNAPWAVTTSGA
jgi:hypothetical protein